MKSLETHQIDWKLLFSLCLIFFVPQFLFVFLKLSSLAYGLLISCFLLFLINLKFIFKIKLKKEWVLYSLFLLLYIVILYFDFNNNSNDKKLILSLVAFSFLIFSSLLFSESLIQLSFPQIKRTFFIFLLLLILIGWVAVFFKFSYFGYQDRYKPVFPFSEESHYALIVGGISCAYASISNKKTRWFIFANISLQALLFPNLTLLVFCVFFAFLFFLRSFPALLMGAILCISAMVFFDIFISDDIIRYFESRLILSSESKNLTALVYLQGWQDAYISFLNSFGFGLGFQKLGSQEAGPIGERIFELHGEYFNREDGGFLAAKIISELGFIGIILVLIYIYIFLKFTYKSKLLYRKKSSRDVFFYTLIICFFVELFLRGYGYFSPGIIVLICSVRNLRKNAYN